MERASFRLIYPQKLAGRTPAPALRQILCWFRQKNGLAVGKAKSVKPSG